MTPTMDNVRDLEAVSNVLILALIVWSALVSLVYMVFYLWRPWHTTPQGRALMVKAVGNVILLDALALPFALFGDYPFRWVVRLVGMVIFTAGITYLAVTLFTSPGARDYPPWSWRRQDRR